ncbi:lysozyme M1 [Secundilactobacillus silagincola]|uniref:Lysozyme M1 n=1 Tax=Secundilactobacillus silagincola TaxID=1714681 RepID=A0A1Z5J2S7_9LACO|nr:GH25 family lysozyme [Secundilactobacillus silagincola]GAX08345.1 lysozyme M1 [Secundilactobacillus silagincola]
MQLSKQLLTGLATAGAVLLVGARNASATLSPSSSQPRTDMVDLSSWQSNLGASDYQKLHDAGVKAVAIKATEGTSYTSPVLQQQSQDAENASLAVNYYHFAHFTSVASAKAEAQNFINAVQSVTSSKNMVMVVDFESSELSGLSKSQNDADLAAFDGVLNAAGYNKTDLYTMSSWVGNHIDTNTNNKGWIAQWPSNPTGTEYPSANAWQWASDYRFSGESQNLDVSQLNNEFYVNGSASTAVHTSPSSSTPKTTLVKVPAPAPTSSSNYSAARSNSVTLVWRGSMHRHAYWTLSGARYSKHLGIKYADMKNLPHTTWYTDGHEKLYRKASHSSAIYYHVRSGNGKHSGWIWRGYLHAGVNPNA